MTDAVFLVIGDVGVKVGRLVTRAEETVVQEGRALLGSQVAGGGTKPAAVGEGVVGVLRERQAQMSAVVGLRAEPVELCGSL